MDYEKIYNKLIEYRKQNILTEDNCEYFESHHIVPKSIDKKLKYKKSNKINLTVREHFIAHLLLKQIYKKKYGIDSYQYQSMVKTCFLFANKHKDMHINSRTIERLRIAYKKLPSPRKGVHLSQETKEKLRQINLGKKQSEETKRKRLETRIKNGNNKLSEKHKQILIQSRLGSKHSEETKEKIRQKKLGFKHSEESKRKISLNSAKIYLGKHIPEEIKKKISLSKTGEKNPHFNKKWVFNPITNHRICVNESELETYFKNGYLRGKNGKGGISHHKKVNNLKTEHKIK